MYQWEHRASRRRFLKSGCAGAIGGIFLSGCLGSRFASGEFEGFEEWSATFGGGEWDNANSVIETNAGGYLFSGNTQSFAEDTNAWVVKVDDQGSEDWMKIFDGGRRSLAYSVIETNDGGYLFAGAMWTQSSDYADALVVKLNVDGGEEWRVIFGGDWSDMARSVIETVDGGYLFVGETRSFSDTGIDAWIMKLTSDGAEEWSENVSEKEWDSSGSVIQVTDGGYLLAGSSGVLAVDVPREAWLTKLDADGNEEWREIYSGNRSAGVASVIETGDNGYLFVGNWSSRSLIDWFDEGGAWVVKLNVDGSEVWSKTFGGEFFEQDRARSVIETSDNGYLFAGNTRSFTDEGVDAWLMKLNVDGSEEWQETFGDVGQDRANAVIETSDGGYLFAGVTESVGEAHWDAWLVKLAS